MKVILFVLLLTLFCLHTKGESWWGNFYNCVFPENDIPKNDIPKNETVNIPNPIFVCVDRKVGEYSFEEIPNQCGSVKTFDVIINQIHFNAGEELIIDYNHDDREYTLTRHFYATLIGTDKNLDILVLLPDGFYFAEEGPIVAKLDRKDYSFSKNGPVHSSIIHNWFKEHTKDLIKKEEEKGNELLDDFETETNKLKIFSMETQEKRNKMEAEISRLSFELKKSMDLLKNLLKLQEKNYEQ